MLWWAKARNDLWKSPQRRLQLLSTLGPEGSILGVHLSQYFRLICLDALSLMELTR